jgi:hypothetical protein
MKEEVYLAADLQHFLFDPNVVDPRVVARDSVNEFDIHSIINIRGPRRKNKWTKSTVEFLVHWDGYDASYDTWEPYSGLRNTAQLHQYLRDNDLTYLIPKNLEEEVRP